MSTSGRPRHSILGNRARFEAGSNGQPRDSSQHPWEVKPGTGATVGPGETAAVLVERDFPPPRFAVDDLIAEGLTVLGGRPKQGKSWLSLLIAWAVAAGYELDGRGVKEGEVLYLALEDTARRLKRRLLMLNAVAKWEVPAGLHLHTEWPRADAGGLYFLAEWLSARKDTARLVVVDTLAKFRAPQKGHGNSYAEDYAALGDLQKLFGSFNVSGLVVHHTRKLRAEDPFDELSGTLGLSGAADSLCVLDRDRGSATGQLFVTGRDLPESTIPVTFRATDCRWQLGAAKDGIDAAGRMASPEAGKLEQCKEWLKDFLVTYAYPSAEIEFAARAAGYSPRTLRDAKVALGKNGTQEVTHRNFGGGGSNDWWSGIGQPDQWTRRPVRTNGESESHKSAAEEAIPP